MVFVVKKLTRSLDNASVIIECVMCSHNVLVDYRDKHCDKIRKVNKRNVFAEDTENNNTVIMVIGNGIGSAGSISNQEK